MPTPLIIIICAFFVGAILRYREPDGDIDSAIQVGIGMAFYMAIGVGAWCWLSGLVN